MSNYEKEARKLKIILIVDSSKQKKRKNRHCTANPTRCDGKQSGLYL